MVRYLFERLSERRVYSWFSTIHDYFNELFYSLPKISWNISQEEIKKKWCMPISAIIVWGYWWDRLQRSHTWALGTTQPWCEFEIWKDKVRYRVFSVLFDEFELRGIGRNRWHLTVWGLSEPAIYNSSRQRAQKSLSPAFLSWMYSRKSVWMRVVRCKWVL